MERVIKKETLMEATERGDNEKSELRQNWKPLLKKPKPLGERMEEKTVAAAKATDKAVREHPYQPSESLRRGRV